MDSIVEVIVAGYPQLVQTLQLVLLVYLARTITLFGTNHLPHILAAVERLETGMSAVRDAVMEMRGRDD